MPERRVVITGMGLVTPVGNSIETFWSNLKNGVSGIRTIDAFDTTEYDCKIGGQVRDFDPKQFFKNPKDVRRTDRFTHLAMAAAKMAVADSGIDLDNLKERDRFGVIVSTGIGGLKTLQDQLQVLLAKGPGRNSPFTIPMLISNMAGGVISMEFDLRGPNLCIVTACATSNNAIGESWRIIKFGDADIFLAGGAEASIVEIGVAGFSAMKALSKRNDEPERASRPFDRDRDGFVMSEGSGVVVVEELEHARARGATIYAEIVGFGTNSDGCHVTHPNAATMQIAMELALADADLPPSAIGYINAHGTGTQHGDVAESQATWNLFRDRVPISSLKSYMGHTLGACGALEAWISIEMMRAGWFAPTINLAKVDPECAGLDYVVEEGRELDCEYVISNNFAFGGINTSLIFRRCA